MPNVGSR
jgi:hypothetical protein